jgi:hypothetical protein
MPRHPVRRSCPPILVYFIDAASVQETAIVCGNQVGILDFARFGSCSFAAAPRSKRGGKGIRTPGLLIANETLYQLSYTPISPVKIGLQKDIKKTACPPVLHTCIFTLALTRLKISYGEPSGSVLMARGASPLRLRLCHRRLG